MLKHQEKYQIECKWYSSVSVRKLWTIVHGFGFIEVMTFTIHLHVQSCTCTRLNGRQLYTPITPHWKELHVWS